MEELINCIEKLDLCKSQRGARVYTLGFNPPVTEGEVWHDHPAKPAKTEIRKAFSDIKSNNSSEARSAIQKAQVSLSVEAQVLLPSYDELRQRLQSKVNPYSKYPKIDKKEDLLIPDEFKFTCKNENFLIYDSGQDDPDRIIIFGTESNLNLLKLYLNWYVDAILSATENIFDDTISHGCFFHFKQNLWRKIQSLGFQSDYNEKSETRLFFKQIAALAFVPIVDLIYTYDLFRKDESNQAFLKIYNNFVKYFEATYIGELKRGKGGGRKHPRFKQEIWNVYK
ncbi:unnamed protein product, partial [Brachionus calyciflorus]